MKYENNLLATKNDPRYIKLKIGLYQLNNEQLLRLIQYEGDMCTDDYLYDEERDLYCPLAIALGINCEKPVGEMTNTKLKEIIENEYKLSLNPMKGVEGEFYRENRDDDVKRVCQDILEERKYIN